MAKNLPLTEAKLVTLGLSDVLKQLLTGPLHNQIELPFATLKTAKTVQALLYNWLWFYPYIKEGLSIRLNQDIATLTLIPRGLPERRGRKGGKL